ncbi:putative arrestin domain-containing protein 3, partial [Apostichopus japonicus]
IRMTFIGRADVEWTETESRGKAKVTIFYIAGETYFNHEITIYGAGRNAGDDEQITLQSGTHKFPFKFQLPDTPMPCPFEGTMGHIRYVARAVIDRPWKFDHSTKRAFSMSGVPHDLNNVQEPLSRVYCEDEKTVCCLCCATGPIAVSCNTDKRAYVPGETIFISAILNNSSNRSVHTLEAELIQSVTYFARREGVGALSYRSTSHVITSVKSEGCGAYSTVNWTQKPLIIPAVPPNEIEGCNFIRTQYYVKVTADVASTPFDVDLMMEIVIGTVPVEGSFLNHPTLTTTQSSADAPRKTSKAPSYEAASHGVRRITDPEDNEYTFGQTDYTPFYTFLWIYTAVDASKTRNIRDVSYAVRERETS